MMLASVLNSSQAVEMSIYVVRAFVQLKEMLGNQKKILQKLRIIEKKVVQHDDEIESLFIAIRNL